MIRAFIALPLPSEVEQRLGKIIADFSRQSREVKWVRAKAIHLTVKFLGETDEKLIEKIGRSLDEIAGQFAPMSALIDRLGGFPNLRRPRVIWAGSSEPPEEAAKVARHVDIAMRRFRFEKEKRAFKPHLTLGRVRQGRRVDDLATYIESYRFEPFELKLDRLVLFKSTLTPQGAIYDRLHEVKLGQVERFGG